jgi:hypothetical protein
MNRLLKAAAALLCAFGINSLANAQLTTVTAAHIYMGGVLVPAGTVTFTPVSSSGTPIAFAQGGGGLNLPFAWSCTIASGAITGSCQIPDSALTTPANIAYAITVIRTSDLKQWTLQAVPGITGTTWALDAYGPPANTTNVQPIQLSYGTAAAPNPCVTPSMYIRNNSGGQLYICVAGVPVLVTGTAASVTAAAMASAVVAETGCTTAHFAWIPGTLDCEAVGAPSGPTSIAGATADYDFLQGSGTVLTDISGNGNNGTFASGALTPIWTPVGVSFSGQQGIQLPAGVNAGGTILIAAYITPLPPGNGAGANNAFPALMTSTIANGLNLLYANDPLISTEFTYSPTIFANNAVLSASNNLLSGFHVYGFTLGTGGGSKDHIYLDGVEVASYIVQGSSAGFQTSGNLYLGSCDCLDFAASGLNGTMYRAVILPSQTAAQIAQESLQIREEVAHRGVAVAPFPIPVTTPTLYVIGTSIDCGFVSGGNCTLTPWPAATSLTNQPSYTIVNDGIPGIDLSAILSSEPNRVAPGCITSSGPANTVVDAGTNDLVFKSVASVTAWLAGEVQLLKKAGCNVYVGTMISRTGTGVGSATMDSLKDSYDANILSSWKAWGADGVIDFAANPTMGADGANSGTIGTIEGCPGATTDFQSECTHPTQAGQNLLAIAASNSLNYYYGTTAAAPHIVATTTYTMVSGDRFVEAAPTANAAYTMPDCTGPSGEVYTINNPQAAHTLTITGGTSQPINGLSSAITIPSNSTVTLRDVANPKTVSGCQWAM